MDPRVLTSGSRRWLAVPVVLCVVGLLGTAARESGIAQRRRAAKRAAWAGRR